MRVSLIVAVSEGGIIGRDGGMPWHLSADLRRFKALTMGHHLIVGRKTWEAIGRPLPGREMIVVTRRRGDAPPGVTVVASPEAALAHAEKAFETEAFIAGGGELYRALLPRADRLYWTRVHGEIEGDTTFPPIDLTTWREVHREELPADEKNSHATTFSIYER